MSRRNNREQVYKIRFRDDGMIKTSIVTTANRSRLESMARSYPNVIGVSKATNNVRGMIGVELKNLTTELMKDIAQPKMTPLAMDEFLWMRRNKRVENKNKDRQID